MLFHCTVIVLWQQHHSVFRAAGWNFRRFWNRASRGFARLQLRIWHFSLAERHCWPAEKQVSWRA